MKNDWYKYCDAKQHALSFSFHFLVLQKESRDDRRPVHSLPQEWWLHRQNASAQEGCFVFCWCQSIPCVIAAIWTLSHPSSTSLRLPNYRTNYGFTRESLSVLVLANTFLSLVFFPTCLSSQSCGSCPAHTACLQRCPTDSCLWQPMWNQAWLWVKQREQCLILQSIGVVVVAA